MSAASCPSDQTVRDGSAGLSSALPRIDGIASDAASFVTRGHGFSGQKAGVNTAKGHASRQRLWIVICVLVRGAGEKFDQ